jgi:hypothetical protein
MKQFLTAIAALTFLLFPLVLALVAYAYKNLSILSYCIYAVVILLAINCIVCLIMFKDDTPSAGQF